MVEWVGVHCGQKAMIAVNSTFSHEAEVYVVCHY